MNYEKYIIPRYINYAYKSIYECNTRNNVFRFESHVTRHVPPKPQPKSEKASMMNEARTLVSKYTRVFNKLEALGIDVNGMIEQARGRGSVRIPKIK